MHTMKETAKGELHTVNETAKGELHTVNETAKGETAYREGNCQGGKCIR